MDGYHAAYLKNTAPGLFEAATAADATLAVAGAAGAAAGATGAAKASGVELRPLPPAPVEADHGFRASAHPFSSLHTPSPTPASPLHETEQGALARSLPSSTCPLGQIDSFPPLKVESQKTESQKVEFSPYGAPRFPLHYVLLPGRSTCPYLSFASQYLEAKHQLAHALPAHRMQAAVKERLGLGSEQAQRDSSVRGGSGNSSGVLPSPRLVPMLYLLDSTHLARRDWYHCTIAQRHRPVPEALNATFSVGNSTFTGGNATFSEGEQEAKSQRPATAAAEEAASTSAAAVATAATAAAARAAAAAAESLDPASRAARLQGFSLLPRPAFLAQGDFIEDRLIPLCTSALRVARAVKAAAAAGQTAAATAAEKTAAAKAADDGAAGAGAGTGAADAKEEEEAKGDPASVGSSKCIPAPSKGVPWPDMSSLPAQVGAACARITGCSLTIDHPASPPTPAAAAMQAQRLQQPSSVSAAVAALVPCLCRAPRCPHTAKLAEDAADGLVWDAVLAALLTDTPTGTDSVHPTSTGTVGTGMETRVLALAAAARDGSMGPRKRAKLAAAQQRRAQGVTAAHGLAAAGVAAAGGGGAGREGEGSGNVWGDVVLHHSVRFITLYCYGLFTILFDFLICALLFFCCTHTLPPLLLPPLRSLTLSRWAPTRLSPPAPRPQPTPSRSLTASSASGRWKTTTGLCATPQAGGQPQSP